MLTTQIIEKKRDGAELRADEIQFMVRGITDGSIPDYQISAWAMAVLCRGMNETEIALLTESMLHSGNCLTRCTDRLRVDKHSTGGLGDKTSLILAPLLACFDLDVPMLSGRGLGITGGTLDKLEAYSGYRCNLQAAEIDRQLKRIGCVITGTTPSIAPADQKLYGLRDVTGTVPSIPLITASIMSKKLAETLDALVLDVKWGSGAFMQSLDQAKQLQQSLVATGLRVGVATTSLLTDMNQPLGRMVGNACEANESVEVLQGSGPDDVLQLTIQLAAQLLLTTGKSKSLDQAVSILMAAIADGRAFQRYQAMIESQGGKFVDRLPLASEHVICAPTHGFLTRIDGQMLGHSIIEMGGGRRQQKDAIDHQVGLEMLRKIGDPVASGQPLVKLFYSGSPSQLEKIAKQIQAALTIENQPAPPPQLILNH
jgi:pyrimidine-nucleoside phosphorylase